MTNHLYLAESLMDCIEDNNLSGLKILIQEKQANPNTLLPNKGISPFHYIIGNDSEEFAIEGVKLFLQFGGDPNISSEDGMTPVHIAAIWRKLNILSILLNNGGNPYLIDFDLKSSFDYAIENEYKEVIQLLSNFENQKNRKSCDQIKLTKVIMTTDNVEIEYMTNDDGSTSNLLNFYLNNALTPVSSSETNKIVEEWCDKHSNYVDFLNTTFITNCECSVINSFNSVNNLNSVDQKALTDTFNRDHRKSIIKRGSIISGHINGVSFNKGNHIDFMAVSETNTDPLSVAKQCIHNSESDEQLRYNNITSNANEINTVIKDGGQNQSLKISGINTIYSSSSTSSKCRISDNTCSKVNLNDCIVGNIDISNSSNTFSDQYLTCNGSNVSQEVFNKNCTSNNLFTNTSILTSDQSDKSANKCQIINNSHKSISIPEINIINVTNDNSFNLTNSKLKTDTNSYLDKIENIVHDMHFLTLNSKCKYKDEDLISQSTDKNISQLQLMDDNKLMPVNALGADTSNLSENKTIISVAEEYKYTDDENGIVLIEKRLLVNPISDKLLKFATGSNTSSTISLPASFDYDTDTLRCELTTLGYLPGPITKTTKRIYLKKLVKFHHGKIPPKICENNRIYSVELEHTLRTLEWYKDLTKYTELEQEVAKQFSNTDPKQKWREGVAKSSFTYLLLDPRITNNLPLRSENLTLDEVWKIFLAAIFYVGKGKRSRPYAHLYQSVSVWNKNDTIKDKKIKCILDIWKEQCGVVCLHVFQNVIPVEAYTREAAMIDVIGLKNLKNNKRGDYYGIATTWPFKKRKLLGVYLLYRAMQIFLNEGERQLRPEDIE